MGKMKETAGNGRGGHKERAECAPRSLRFHPPRMSALEIWKDLADVLAVKALSNRHREEE